MLSGLPVFTLIHVYLSLIGIIAGFVVMFAMFAGRRANGWTAIFIITTLATVITGFLFPFHKFLPSHAVGILTLIALLIAMYARYGRKMTGGWRKTWVISSMSAQYFNVFVLVVQLFQKEPALKALAPTQTEPPFKIAQGVVLLSFVILTIAAAARFRESRNP